MRQLVSTITSKGQVTLPAEVRRHLGLKQRDKIAFVIEAEGGVRLVVPDYPTIEALRGIAGTLPRPMSWQEVKDTAREDYVAEKLGLTHG